MPGFLHAGTFRRPAIALAILTACNLLATIVLARLVDTSWLARSFDNAFALLVSWYVALIGIVCLIARRAACRLWPREMAPPPALTPLTTSTSTSASRELWIVMTTAALLFLAAVWWGLPDQIGWAPDELTPSDLLDAARQSFSHGWYSIYPPLYYVVLSAWDLPFTLLDSLHLLDRAADPAYSLIFLANRLLSVLMALATVGITYALARDLRGHSAGIWAALILIAALPFTYYAKLANADVPYVFLFALSLVFYLRLLRRSVAADFYLFTLTGMLAVCLKDQAYGFYVLPACYMAAMAIWSALRRQAPPPGVPSWRVLLGMGLIVVATFAIGENVLFNPSGFREHLDLIVGNGSLHYRMFPGTPGGQARMLIAALAELGRIMSWPLAIAAACAVSITLRRGPREARWLLLPAASYYICCISLVMYHYDRFFLGIVVVLAIVTGVWIAERPAPSRQLSGTPLSRMPLVSMPFVRRGLLAVALAYAFARVASLDALLILDARYSAERWLASHVRRGRVVAAAGQPAYLPRHSVVPFAGSPRISPISRR
jgi:hypothetical protein